MSKIKSAVVAALTLATMGVAAQAAPTLTLTFKIDNVFATPGSTLNPIAVNKSSFTSTSVAPVDVQIEVDATVTGLTAGTSLGNLEFDTDLTSLSAAHPATAFYAWKPNNIQWTDAEAAGNSVFSTNQDGGTSSTDLQAVAAVINSAGSSDFGFGGDPADPRETIGEVGGIIPSLKLGTFKVLWNPALGDASIGALADANFQFSSIDDNSLVYSTVIGGGTVSNNISLINGGVVTGPEPASLGLLAIGGLSLITRRRRTA